MKRSYWRIVGKIISKSDIILEILDARNFEESRNEEVEDKVKRRGKKLILVANKVDLISKKEQKKLKNCVYVSTKERKGIGILRQKILSLAPRHKVVVGVVGYPNTGKSSVINSLAGRHKAKTSPKSGFTRGYQYIRIGRILLIDTPGVFSFGEKDDVKLALIGSKDQTRLKDPEFVALKLIKVLKGKVEEFYKIKDEKSYEKKLVLIALKLRKLKKGNEPNTIETAKIIIKDWQKGKIR